MTDISISQILK